MDKVDVVELGECGGGIAGSVSLVSEASNGSCDGKDMTVSVSKNVTRLRELEEAVDEDEEDGDEDGMKKGNIKTVEQPVLSAQIEPSEYQLELGKSRRNKIPHKTASPKCEEEGKAPVEKKSKRKRVKTSEMEMSVII